MDGLQLGFLRVQYVSALILKQALTLTAEVRGQPYLQGGWLDRSHLCLHLNPRNL